MNLISRRPGSLLFHAWLERGGIPISELPAGAVAWGVRPLSALQPFLETRPDIKVDFKWEELPSYKNYPLPLERASLSGLWPRGRILHVVIELLESSGTPKVSNVVGTAKGSLIPNAFLSRLPLAPRLFPAGHFTISSRDWFRGCL